MGGFGLLTYILRHQHFEAECGLGSYNCKKFLQP